MKKKLVIPTEFLQVFTKFATLVHFKNERERLLTLKQNVTNMVGGDMAHVCTHHPVVVPSFLLLMSPSLEGSLLLE